MAKNKGVPKEDIAAIYYDDEKKEQLIFTKSQLINQLSKICPKIAVSFDKVYEKEFRELSAELSSILPKQFIGFKEVVDEKDELRVCCGSLLRNASNTFMASTDLLRNGFRFQSGILIRSIIEMCATVVHLLVDQKAFGDFQSDKLKSTYSVSVADKQVPLFGKVWGLLSKFNIHVNTNHADWYPMNEYTDKEEVPSSVILGILGYSLLLLDIVTELTFFHQLGELNYWKQLDKPGMLQFIPPAESRTEWAKSMLDRKPKNS